jgi:hypothetical protein
MKLVAGQSVRDGLTAKQEAFAQEVAKGSTLADAYRKAYNAERMKDSSVWCNASKLMSDAKVAQRVKAIQDGMEQSALHDQARLRRLVLERLHVEATKEENSDASRVRSLELLGKTVAMFSDRVEQVESSRSASEIEQELINRLAELGVSSKAG